MVSDDLPVLAAHLPQGSLRGLDVVHLQCHIGTDPSASPDAPVGPTPRHRVSLLRVGEQ
ncbi:hypothetical protein [Arsenicicoccus cauae]|uniref:hypothetical protein n=1 Tax=Arsenicicoccus cauae TaxID=2663847 RepID=UPI0018A73E6F|nr:hypothetical protein [Arsenicicoccus cauae]